MAGLHDGVCHIQTVRIPLCCHPERYDLHLQCHDVLALDPLYPPQFWGIGCRLLTFPGTFGFDQVGGFGTFEGMQLMMDSDNDCEF